MRSLFAGTEVPAAPTWQVVVLSAPLAILGGCLAGLGSSFFFPYLGILLITGVLLICLRRGDAFLALAILVGVTPLDRLAIIASRGDSVFANTFIPLVGGATFLIWLIVLGAKQQHVKRFSELWLLAGFVLAIVLASVTGVNPYVSLIISLTYFQLMILAFLVVNIVDTPTKLRTLVWVIIISNGAVALYTIVSGEGISYESGFFRAIGARGDPNFAAQQALIALPFAVFFLIGETSLARRITLLCIILTIVTATFLTGSVGGVVGLISAVGLMLVSYARGSPSRSIKAVLWAIMVLAVLVYTVPIPLQLRVQQQLALIFGAATGRSDPFTIGTLRVAIWAAALQVFQLRPLFGVGPGNLEPLIAHYFPKHFYPYVTLLSLGAHNTFLAVAGEFGMFGLAIFGSFIFSSIYQLGRSLGRAQATQLPAKWTLTGNGILVSATVFLVQGLALDSQRVKALWLLVGMCIAYRLLVEQNMKSERSMI